MPSVKVRPDEPFDAVLRRFRRACEKAGVFTESRNREYYEKPSETNRRARLRAERRSKRNRLLAKR